MNNQILAMIFYEMADILEILDVAWKPQAFRNAAKGIENLSRDVEDIYNKEGIIGLRKISGVGQSIALKIIEFIKTGKIKEHQALRKKVPSQLMEMLHIPTLGPKKIKVLHKELKIKTIKQLEKAAESGKIQRLAGFGEKSEKEILSGIQMVQKADERMLIGLSLPIANEIVERLRNLKTVKRVSIAGSTRRMRETTGDLDILVASKNVKSVTDFFANMPEVKKVLVSGKTKTSVILDNNLQCDLRIINENEFGAALQYFTGSKTHNVKVRKIAIKNGFKLSEYGLFNRRTGKLVVAKTEEEVYKKLGMQYPEPELRTNSGEIEAALRGKLPKLVKIDDIKGDFQMHTTWSDGANSIEDMAKVARTLGYQYIAITDHSKQTRIANGMDEKTILKQIEKIKSVDKKISGIKILAGAEVDILADGSLDYSDKILKKLDVVLASVHSGFKQPANKTAERIRKGLSNKYIKIFAHPTGRQINKRKPYAIDIEQLCKIAKETNTILEINASMYRLDLKDIHIRKAIESGVKLSLGTDAHTIEQLNQMHYGVGQARRGWAQKKDIINTMTWAQLKKYWKLK